MDSSAEDSDDDDTNEEKETHDEVSRSIFFLKRLIVHALIPI